MNPLTVTLALVDRTTKPLRAAIRRLDAGGEANRAARVRAANRQWAWDRSLATIKRRSRQIAVVGYLLGYDAPTIYRACAADPQWCRANAELERLASRGGHHA
jgi:hypothetical protein